MRLILPTVVIIICLAGSAQAEEYVDLYPAMDVCCMFSAVCIDLEYCGVCTENHPVTVQFLDVDGEVLGSTTITDNRCSGGADQLYADLDTAVDSVEVCSVRLITEADECCMAEWAAIKVLCQDPCDCDKWRMAWKGDLMCWEHMPELVAEVPQPPPPPEPEMPEIVRQPPEPEIPVRSVPEPEPEPEPEPQPEPEVIHVIGNG